MKKTFSLLIISSLILSSFWIKNPIEDIQNQLIKPDSTRWKIPEGVDPNDENWKGIDLENKAPVQPVSPEEQQKTFLLPEGYSMEPVLTEPAIQQPAQVSFDGNGRMYVLELRTYMLNADSKDELEPKSRISRWEDRDGDGKYETGTAFVDQLVFPRFVLPYGKDAILTMESDADNVYKYTDTNGDGVADKKEFFTSKYGRSGNVEHQQAFMYYGMDNWLYSTVNAFRIRETPNGIIREKTGFNRAQWGITHDDYGKLWFQGGASGVPSYFQFPIHYGNIDVPNERAVGFDIPYGAPIKLGDMQGGMDQIRQPDGSLNSVTGSAGNDIYRGDRLPKSIYGQLFYGEPVARIVRQVNPVVTEGLTTLHNAYQEQKSEFLRSTDPLFRPVDMTTAPDGTLYITDMYRGIIQEGQWTQKGSYLRLKIEQYQLDKVVGLGRIWRLKHKDFVRDKAKPNIYKASTATLVKYLSHPNGWWRDEAQKNIVLRKDKTAIPALEILLKNSTNEVAQIHALWSLEGLSALKNNTIENLAKSKNPNLRIQVLRAGETIYKTGNKALEKTYEAAFADEHVDVQIQAMLSAKVLGIAKQKALTEALAQKSAAKGVKLVAEQILNPPKPRGGLNNPTELASAQKQSLESGAMIYNELCSQCHGNTGMGTPAAAGKLLAPSLAGNMRIQGHPEYAIRTVLHGLEGPIDGRNYTGQLMAPMKDQSDQWIADVISFIRNGLSNDATIIDAETVKRVRAKTASQEKMYSFAALNKEIPIEMGLADGCVASASHTKATRIGGNSTAGAALSYEGWTTGDMQNEGMWFQMQFPKAVKLAEVHFNAPQTFKRGAIFKPGQPPPSVQQYPRKYDVSISLDGNTWQNVYKNKEGKAGDNLITFAGNKAKYLKISLVDAADAKKDEIAWSMKQMKIFIEKE